MTEETGRKVLLPVDQSDHAMRAVQWYFKYGKMPKDYVILFHSVDTSTIIPSTGYAWAGPLPMGAVETMLKEKEKEVKELKIKYVNVLSEAGVTGEFLYSSAYHHAGQNFFGLMKFCCVNIDVEKKFSLYS